MAALLLEGRRILVIGVANNLSIAWGIAEALHGAGAELALTYLNDPIEKRVRPLAESIGCDVVLPCDVQSDEQLDELFADLKERWGQIDGIIHSVAFAGRSELQNRFVNTTRGGFSQALDISAYSLIALAQRAEPLLSDQASLLTLTYLGSQRVIKNYNVMGVAKAALEASVRYLAADLGARGVRVNAISAGPIKTLAASGIPDFKELLRRFADSAPLQRNVELADVAGTALYLLSSLSSGVTGEIVHVDCGFSRMGVL